MCSSRMVSVDLWTSCLQGATFQSLFVLNQKSVILDHLHLPVETDELGMGVDRVQGSVDHVH